MSTPLTNDIMTAKQVVAELGISRGALESWRSRGRITPINYPSNLEKPRVFYRRADVELLKKRSQPISQAG